MITQIELDGFKTFQNFRLELAPFQVIVGANGAGKSNFFDALRLLSRLVDSDLRSAFQELRGEAYELFTTLDNNKTVSEMKIAVELFVEKAIRDSWGVEAKLKTTRLRYELGVESRTDEQGLQRLNVISESLTALLRKKDSWFKKYVKNNKNAWQPSPAKSGRSLPYISTIKEEKTLILHQDGHGGGRKTSLAENVERTILSGVTNTEFPHAFAVREEMRNWKFLQLNPDVLREPSSMLAKNTLGSDGSNLPTTLARMKNADDFLLTDISRDLTSLVPGIRSIQVEEDHASNRYLIKAITEDGRVFSSRVLSDGTLRMLALVTLKNDPQHHGVLCFEEPENGVHPFRLRNVAGILKGLATDFSDSTQADQPLRQLIINTHSPKFISQPELINSLLFAYMPTRVALGKNGGAFRVTKIVPIKSNQSEFDLGIDEPEKAYTLGQVIDYLDSTDYGEALAALIKKD